MTPDKIQEELEKEIEQSKKERMKKIEKNKLNAEQLMDVFARDVVSFTNNFWIYNGIIAEAKLSQHLATKQAMIKEFEKIIDKTKIKFPYPKKSKFILTLKEFEKWFLELKHELKQKLGELKT